MAAAVERCWRTLDSQVLRVRAPLSRVLESVTAPRPAHRRWTTPTESLKTRLHIGVSGSCQDWHQVTEGDVPACPASPVLGVVSGVLRLAGPGLQRDLARRRD